MGSLIGGIIGGIGSIIGGNAAAKKEDEAAKTALTGYNYLNSNPLINGAQSNATAAMGGQNAALGGEAGTIGNINQLLTSNGTNNPAYQNYLDSTGYNFQLQQGTDAITGSAAAKGLLNSGATGKALTSYGQNLASTTFNNYLSQLSGVAGLQGNLAGAYGGIVGQGLSAANAVGSAGTTGGANAGQFQAAAGQSEGSSITNAFNLVGGGVSSGMNNGSLGNFFSKSSGVPSDLAGLT